MTGLHDSGAKNAEFLWQTSINGFSPSTIMRTRHFIAACVIHMLVGAPALAAQSDILQGLVTFDPYAIMKVKSGADAEHLRRELIRYIWEVDGLPDVLPSEVGDPKQALPFDFDSAFPGHVQRLTQVMELGTTTHAYFFQAQNPTRCLFIYHTGHGEPRTAEVRDSLLKRILGGGCDLILATMPLMHDNPQPIVQTRSGPMWLRDHNALGLLASDAFNPLKVFMQPVLAALNYAIKTQGRYEGIYMAGLSGGGWTTTLYAALDPRIKASFPVAGSLPIAVTTFSYRFHS